MDTDLWRLNAGESTVAVAPVEISALDFVDEHLGRSPDEHIPHLIRVVVDSDSGGLGIHLDIRAAVDIP